MKIKAKAAVTLALPALIATGVSYYVYREVGFDKTVGSLGTILGILVYIVIAVMGIASLLSIPVTMALGMGCMFAGFRQGRLAFFCGFLSFALAASNLLFRTK